VSNEKWEKAQQAYKAKYGIKLSKGNCVQNLPKEVQDNNGRGKRSKISKVNKVTDTDKLRAQLLEAKKEATSLKRAVHAREGIENSAQKMKGPMEERIKQQEQQLELNHEKELQQNQQIELLRGDIGDKERIISTMSVVADKEKIISSVAASSSRTTNVSYAGAEIKTQVVVNNQAGSSSTVFNFS
jgi:hypothetical protein